MSIAALTTAFAPPSSCIASDNVWKVYTTCPGNNACYFLLQGPPNTAGCLPPGYKFESTSYYSPAVCPSGYTPACSATNTINKATETAYTCCPTARKFECLSSKWLEAWPFQSSLGCVSNFKDTGSMPVTISDRFSTSVGMEEYDDRGGINAFAVQVRFQATDFATTSSGLMPTNSATPASAPTGGPTSTSTPPNEPASSGLSTGAKAGIGAGVGVAILALFAVLGLMLFRRKKQREAGQCGSVEPYNGADDGESKPPMVAVQAVEAWPQSGLTVEGAVNLPAYDDNKAVFKHEAHSQEVNELPGQSNRIQELHA
ncbi:hypothetical protein DE146DRAFT_500885 [Phaeosphaeria sp. MPI-PUGE-AT-0046c]|nr:hypothetical protein DE146DRAFT_500885 [Phaeosphaeria sp. MPI-PUGE-AT-0046c]